MPRRRVHELASIVVLGGFLALGTVACGASSSSSGATPGQTSAPSTAERSSTSTTGPSTTVPAATDQITYQPFNGSEVDPALRVSSHGSGPCYRYGGGADGRYLYRCGTVQPCVAGPQGTSAPLVCPAQADPTTNDVILWTATSVNTTDFTPAAAKTPWAMLLSNGTICAFVDAAWSGLGPFDCQIESSQGSPADCRQPQPGSGLWITSCQDDKTQASPFTSVTVAKAWF